MARKRYTPEQIIAMLREAEVRLSQGEKTGTICRSLSVSEQSYYRWRREYGGLIVSGLFWVFPAYDVSGLDGAILRRSYNVCFVGEADRRIQESVFLYINF